MKIQKPKLEMLDGNIDGETFNVWFEVNVEPLNVRLGEGHWVECSSYNQGNGPWHKINDRQLHTEGYKAFIIDVEPYHAETATDVLEALLKIEPRSHSEYSAIVERAKEVLNGRD